MFLFIFSSASGELKHSPRLFPFTGRVLGLLVEREEKNYRCMPWLCSSFWNSGILAAPRADMGLSELYIFKGNLGVWKEILNFACK